MSICHNKQYEREFANLMCSQGHHCERIAGSGSAKEAVCDCILLMDKKCFLVEVKSTKDKKFYVRSHIRLQLEQMQAVALRQGVNSLLAIKFKHRGWKQIDISEQIPVAVEC